MSYRFLKENEFYAGESDSGTADQLGANPVVDAADVSATQRLKLFFILVQANGATTTTVTIEDTAGNAVISSVVTQDSPLVYTIPIELVTPGLGLQINLDAPNAHHWSASYKVA